jgi:hypothetical protein
MVQAPEGFEESLQRYDPQLRLRYGGFIKKWIIERIGRVSEGEARLLRFAASRTDADPKALEEWESARNGRHVIHYALYLDQRIHDYLWNHDLQRQGFKVLTRFMRIQEKKVQDKRAKSHELAREAVSIMGHLNRKKGNDIHHGKADQLVREAFHLPARPEPKKSGNWNNPQKPPTGLLDQFGRDLKPRVENKRMVVI